MTQRLNVSSCALSKLDLLGNPLIESLYARDNALMSLDLSGCFGLRSLSVAQTELKTLDVSDCISLLSIEGDIFDTGVEVIGYSHLPLLS